MTLNEISYMCLEILRQGSIVDDERLDTRLLKDWINLKRAQFIKNSVSQNPSDRINLNLYQTIEVTVDVIDVTDAGDYPYINSTTQLYEIVESTTTIPTIVEGKSGPLILSLESEDLMKLPFSVVDYNHLRVAGNGKFNSKIIFGAIRDNKIYFKYNEFFDTYTTVVLRAIFEDPRAVSGFDDETSRYPADLGLIEYIKNGILQIDLKAFLMGVADEENDATGEIK